MVEEKKDVAGIGGHFEEYYRSIDKVCEHWEFLLVWRNNGNYKDEPMIKVSCSPLCGQLNNKWDNIGCVLYSFHD